jgi:hypothetical protein
VTVLAAELRKIPAVVRRDFLVSWSYRLAFVSDVVGLIAGAALFYLIGLMVDPTKIPSYGGGRATYMEFVAVGTPSASSSSSASRGSRRCCGTSS